MKTDIGLEGGGGQRSWRRLSSSMLLLGALASVMVGASGCGKKESIVALGSGKKLSAEEIDKNPQALLPGNAVVYVQADLQAFFGTAYAPQALRIATSLVPIPADANFQPTRDVKNALIGLYSSTSADFAGIVQGSFDPDAIAASAARGSITPLNQPLKATPYANNTIYSTSELGFVLLTKQTLLVGNPAGLRRALDRIRDGKVVVEIPEWELTLLKTPGAEIVIAGDLGAQPVSAALLGYMPFLDKARQVRVVGDFKAPGMNVGGSISYPDSNAAQNGANAMRLVPNMVGWLSWFSGNPFQSLETNVPPGTGELQFKVVLDGQALASLLSQLGMFTSFMAPPPPPPSTTATPTSTVPAPVPPK
ncbi:MAG: hypothetical protein U0165_12965 [Polyangiaceae bacterium]